MVRTRSGRRTEDPPEAVEAKEEEGIALHAEVGDTASAFSQRPHSRELEAHMSPQQVAMARLFARPHTVSLALLALLLLYYVGFNTDGLPPEQVLRRALAAMALIFLLFALLHFRDGPFHRPHPAVWRLVQGVSVLYMMALVFLLFQTPEQARALFKIWYPDVGVPLEDLSWAEDCTLNWTNFVNLLDRFVAVHFVGWLLKATMIRDYWVLHALQLLFEFLEISLSFILPNFAECWWDRWILDVALSNTLGIYVGMKLVNYMSALEYSWVEGKRPSKQPGGSRVGRNIKYVATHMMPESVQRFKWGMLSSPKRMLHVLFIIIVVSTLDVNAFALKAVLWIPHDKNINPYRLAIWYAMGLPACREYYQYVSDPTCKRLGTQSWMVLVAMITECLVRTGAAAAVASARQVILKFGRDGWWQSRTTPSPTIVYSWITAVTLFVLWFAWYFGWRQWRKKKEQ